MFIPENYSVALNMNRLTGRKSVTAFGTVTSLQIANTPCGIWEPKIPFIWDASPVSLEVVSSSAADSAAGAGARTLLLTTLDGSYNEAFNFIALNGVTPVAVPGTHLRCNNGIVTEVGTAFGSNIGNITIRVAGGGTTRDFITAGRGVTQSGKYTVPAGNTITINNFYLVSARTGGATYSVEFVPRIRFNTAPFVNGPAFDGLRQYFSQGNAPIVVPIGFALPEKTDAYYDINSISNNDVNFGIGFTGVLVNNSTGL